MGVTVNNMEWKELKELVERRLNKLAMCKRGVVMSDINSQVEKLGKLPKFTKEERKKIDKGLEKKRQKALTPSLAEIRKYSHSELMGMLTARHDKVIKNRFKHPDEDAWHRSIKMLQEQEKSRIAQLDADFQEVMDEFILGGIDVNNFPSKYNKLEATDW